MIYYKYNKYNFRSAAERGNKMARTEVPLYVKIKEYLLREIREGELKPDDQLPSEKALSEQFQVSRITVRRALAELEEESAIYRRPGKGTFVAEAPRRERR